jgi:hypothetical protein
MLYEPFFQLFQKTNQFASHTLFVDQLAQFCIC